MRRLAPSNRCGRRCSALQRTRPTGRTLVAPPAVRASMGAGGIIEIRSVHRKCRHNAPHSGKGHDRTDRNTKMSDQNGYALGPLHG